MRPQCATAIMSVFVFFDVRIELAFFFYKLVAMATQQQATVALRIHHDD